MDIRTTNAAMNYVAARPATEPDQQAATSAMSVVSDFAANLRETEQIAMTSMTSGVDPTPWCRLWRKPNWPSKPL